MVRKLFGASESYIEDAGKFTKLDALLSLLVYAVAFAGFWGLGRAALIFREQFEEMTALPLALIPVFLVSSIIGIVFLVCRARKQKVLSISSDRKNAKKSLLVGAALCLAYTGVLVPLFLREGNPVVGIASIIEVFFMAFFVTSFFEEFIFRAYIGPRLYGVFKWKFLSIVVTGLLFTMAHAAGGLGALDVGFFEFFVMDEWRVGSGFFGFTLAHILFHWFYAKFNNIWGPVLLHFYFNFTRFVLFSAAS